MKKLFLFFFIVLLISTSCSTIPSFHDTVSIDYDRRLYKQDIAGSMAHAKMLAKQGVISGEDAAQISQAIKSLNSLRQFCHQRPVFHCAEAAGRNLAAFCVAYRAGYRPLGSVCYSGGRN
jgi:hypothetical protein